ncbi:MAG: hypothetical protein DDT19_02893 [Syntrophomonadaceae bacterium]|nr:hypothetical protein [Bacillota bacterium]
MDYRVYRTTAGGTPATTGLIGTITLLTFDDTGLAASGAVPTVDLSGNIGIGTTSPASLMHIVGTTAGDGGTSSGAGSILHIRQNTDWTAAQPWALFVEGFSYLGGFRIHGRGMERALFQTIVGTPLGFATRGNDAIIFTQLETQERMRIASGGNVGIGVMFPGAKFHVIGVDSFNVHFAGNISGATGTGLVVTNANNVGIGITTPAHQLQLSTDSAAKPSTNTWTVVSDRRLKKSIEPANLDLCYNAVKNIPLKFYKWRDDVYTVEQVRDRSMLGWIADDVEKVYPKAVKTIPFEFLTKEKIEDCKSVNNDQVYAALYGAVQKLIEKVEALERRIR